MLAHTRSEALIGAAFSYWLLVHVVSGAQVLFRLTQFIALGMGVGGSRTAVAMQWLFCVSNGHATTAKTASCTIVRGHIFSQKDVPAKDIITQ